MLTKPRLYPSDWAVRYGQLMRGYAAAKSTALLLLLAGCVGTSETALNGLVGRDVVVSAEPTVIVAGSRSEVRERQWQGILVSVDEDWVVIEADKRLQAIDRDKVVTIVSAGE